MAKEKVKGTLLKVTISTVLTNVPYITRLKPPGRVAQSMDCTTIDSATNEKDKTISNSTDITGAVIYDPNNSVHQFLELRAADDTTFPCELVFPSGKKKAFTGQVLQFDPAENDVLGRWEVPFVIQVCGAIVDS